MKNILVPIEDHRGMGSVLRTAQLAAEKFQSRIEGIGLGPDFEALLATDYGVAVTLGDQGMKRDLEKQARQIFETFSQSPAAMSSDKISFAWNADGLSTDKKIGSLGRLYDLIVVGRPGADAHDPRQATLEAALFESGRPILIAPPRAPEVIGRTVVISWNASTETARTLSDAMPFLRLADRVIVLSVSASLVPGPSAERLVAALKWHGLPVELKVNTDTTKPGGRTILMEATKLGADLLIKGGYTQSRLRQMIFGGATSQILAEADIPVFMAH